MTPIEIHKVSEHLKGLISTSKPKVTIFSPLDPKAPRLPSTIQPQGIATPGTLSLLEVSSSVVPGVVSTCVSSRNL